MRRACAAGLVVSLLLPCAALAVGKDKALYVGGTVALAGNTEGVLGLTDQEKLLFIAEKGGGVIEIPYRQVEELEYGQRAGRRVVTAILLSPLALFAKRRRHYLTVSYKDADGKDQAVVLELGKDIVRTALAVAEARSGRKVIYQDEEAAKHRAN